MSLFKRVCESIECSAVSDRLIFDLMFDLFLDVLCMYIFQSMFMLMRRSCM